VLTYGLKAVPFTKLEDLNTGDKSPACRTKSNCRSFDYVRRGAPNFAQDDTVIESSVPTLAQKEARGWGTRYFCNGWKKQRQKQPQILRLR
jgi:hypothetical protein